MLRDAGKENNRQRSSSKGRRMIKSPIKIRDKIKELEEQLEKQANQHRILVKQKQEKLERAQERPKDKFAKLHEHPQQYLQPFHPANRLSPTPTPTGPDRHRITSQDHPSKLLRT
jgi:hypothetical protein